MKFELKNIKMSKFASHETFCFEATLYIDGVRSYHVSNDGNGGCNDIHRIAGVEPKYTLDQINNHFANLPKEKSDLGFEFQPTLDFACSDLVGEHVMRKDLKRSLSDSLLFTKRNEKGFIFTVPLKQQGVKFKVDDIIPHLGDDIEHVLNQMDFDDAMELYLELK